MNPKERAEKIREGNKSFNEGDYSKARALFLETDYKDGLIRMGDYFFYERRLPILAFGYYKKAGYQRKVDEIFQRMILALGQWIGMDKLKIQPIKPPQIPDLSPDDFIVHPILKQKALEILGKKT
ncbi:MAG: hypothetical protein L6Q54_11155 [Leptospiraceae bacterium]|nr:hypothetical protein [Leptospiraceae bacterium]MCK6381786.1 hypothetical protein [Leptospiraceae bacterium]NUM41644.1 hypothetical protein [Leptospiraceae bacterium]